MKKVIVLTFVIATLAPFSVQSQQSAGSLASLMAGQHFAGAKLERRLNRLFVPVSINNNRAALLLGADYGGLESARLTGQTEDETESLRIELLGRVRDSGLEAVLAEGRSMSLADVARFVLDDCERRTKRDQRGR